jgi:hypothetical protein
MKDCAYIKVCKGICSEPNSHIKNCSCIKENKSEEEYWSEIQEAMVAKGRLERIRHYLSSNPKVVRIDIVKKWATIN